MFHFVPREWGKVHEFCHPFSIVLHNSQSFFISFCDALNYLFHDRIIRFTLKLSLKSLKIKKTNDFLHLFLKSFALEIQTTYPVNSP